jgi:autotransporter-associated beta strand protein
MLVHTTFRKLGAIIALGLAMLLLAQTASAAPAATYNWAGVGTTWNTAGNWGGTVPSASDVGQFSLSSYGFQPNLTATASIGSLLQTGGGAVTITGSALTINSTTIGTNASTGIEMDPGAGALTISSSLVLGGAQTWLNNSGSLLTVTGNIATAGNLLTIAGNSNSSFSGVISGSGGFTMNGSGLATMSGVNTFTGNTTINGGTLQLNTGNAGNGELASPTISVNSGGYLALNAADVLGYTNNRNALTINGGTVSNITAGSRVTIQNTITMIGGLLTGTGTGDVNGSYSFNMASGTNAFNATSDASGNPALINCRSISPQGGNMTFNVTRGVASPASDLTISAQIVPYGGNGNGIVETGNGILTLTASNTYTGSTTISGGTLVAANNNALNSGTVTLNPATAATLAFNTTAPSIGGLASSGAGTSTVVLGAGGSPTVLTLGRNASVTTYGGNISEATAGSSLTIAGGGLTLGGVNTFTGGINVTSGGIGFVSTANVPAVGAVTIASGAAIGGAAYPNVNTWIANLGSFSVSPSAAVAITANSSETVNMSPSYPTLSLGSIGNNTFSGTLNPSGNTYYLGGGAGTLYVANAGGLADSAGARSVVINSGAGGSVALLGTNTYTGATTVVGGTLKLANTASALGSQGAATIVNGGALDVGGQVIEGATPYTFTISGTGSAGGAIVNTGATGWLKSVTLGGDATIYPTTNEINIGSNSGTDGTLNLAGHTLTKSGPGTLVLNGLTYSGSGNIVINQGTVQLVSDYFGTFGAGGQQTVALNGTGTITVNSGGALTTQSYNRGANGINIGLPIILNGGTLGDSYPSMNGTKFTSPITLAANSTFNFVGGYGGNVTSNISGNGALTINSDGSGLNISGTNNTYTGLNTVNVGTVNVSNNQSAANGGWTIGPASANTTTVNFVAGSTIAISAASGLQVGSNAANGTANQTLNVYGTLNNSGTAFLGRTSIATVQSGGVWNQTGNLTIEGFGGYSAQATIAAGGLLNYTAASPIAVTGAAANSGNGTLTIAGTLATPQGFQTITTPTTGNGIVQLQSGGVLQLTANIADLTTIGSGGAAKPQFQLLTGGGIINTNGYNTSVSQNITGAGGLSKAGNGTLTLGGANTFTGVTLVNGGVLALTNNSALGGSTLDTSGVGALNISALTGLTLGGLQGANNLALVNGSAAAVPLTVGGNGSSTLFWGNLSDAGLGSSVTKVGNGTLILGGSSAYTGGTNINAGTLVYSSSASLPAPGSINVANGATIGTGWAVDQTFFPYLAAASLSNSFTVALGTSDVNNLDFSNAGANLAFASLGAYANATYTGTLTPNNGVYRLGGGGNAVLTFNSQLTDGNSLVVGGPGTVVLNSSLGNTYTGGTTITGGTLNINSDSALGTTPGAPTTNVTFTAASTLQAGAAGISLSANRNIALTNGAAVTVDTSGNNMTVGGAISGSGSIIKIGNGTLTLANTETYSGSTKINVGQLALDFSQPTSPANNIVPSTSALTLAGGSLAIIGNPAAADSQTFNGTTFSSGANTINASSGTNSLALGAITRSVGSTVDFVLPSFGSITTTTSNASPNATILGGYATTGGSTWAVAGGSSPYTISGLAAGSYNSSFSAGANVDPNASGTFTLASGTTTINSLRFNAAGSASLTIGASNAMVITTGGLLETANVGASAVSITGGTLIGPAGSDLVVTQNNTSSSLTISSIIANSTAASATALTKSGPGTVYLMAANTYTGGTYINGGILALGNNGGEIASAMGTGTVTINPGGTLGFYPGSTGSAFNIPNNIVLNGGKIHQEDGLQHLTGAISVLANSTLEGRWFSPKSLWVDGVLGGSANLNVTDGGNGVGLYITNPANTFSGSVIAGNSNLNIFLEANTALQFATVNMGSSTGNLVLASTSASTNVIVAGLQGTASTVKNGDANARTLTVNYNGLTPSTFGGKLGDGTNNGNNFAFVKSGIGFLSLTGANNYVGGTTVTGGVLQMGNFSALGSSTGNLTVSDAVLDLNGNSPTVGAVTLASGSILGTGTALTGSSFNVQSGAISPSLGGASAPLTKTTNGLVTLAGANSYGGGTTVSGGTLQLLSGATLPSNGALTANGGLLDLGGYSPTFSQLSGAAGVITDNSAGAGTTYITATSGSFNGSIQNGPAKTIALTMNGPGTLTLGGSNNYAGTTNVYGGALLVNGTHSGGDAYSVQGGTLGGAGTVSGTNTVTLSYGTMINPGPATALGSIGTLRLPNLVTSGGATANFDLAGTTTSGSGVNDLIAVTGNLSLTGITTVEVNPTAGTLASGSAYTLFTYGTLDPASTASGSPLTLGPGLLGPRQTAAFSYGSGNNSAIQLTINGFNANLTWIGTSSTTWDQNDTGNLPWTGAPTPSANFFATKDNVTFNNSAVATTVNIGSTVSPGSVTVTGSKNFVFTGGGDISDGTSLKVLGPGTLTVANMNDYVQGTFIQGGGKLILGINNGLPIAGTVTLGSSGSNGTLDLAGYSQTLGGLAVGAGATAANQVVTASTGISTLTYGGPGSTSFAGSIQDTAATTGGVLALDVASGLLNVSGNNTYTGGTTLNGGTLQAGAPLALQNTVITPAGGALDLGGLNATIGGLTGYGALTAANGTLSVGGAGISSQFDGTLAGSIPLVKVGSGTFTLTGAYGANTYSGPTLVNGGILQLATSAAVAGSPNIVVSNGGGLLLNGGFNLPEPVTIRGNGPAGMGAIESATDLNALSGAVSLSAPATIQSDSGTLKITGGIVNGGNLLTLGGPGNLTVNTTGISGAGALVKQGAGTVTLSVSSPYSGGTTVNAGLLYVTAGGWYTTRGIGGGMLTVNPGATAEFTQAHGFGYSDGGQPATINDGTLVFDHENYVTNLYMTGGTLQGGGESRAKNGTVYTYSSTATSVIANTTNLNTGAQTYNVSAGSAGVDLLVSGNIFGSNSLTKTGVGEMVLSGTNTYTGGTTVNNGTLVATDSQAFADGSNLSVGNPTLLSQLPEAIVPSSAAPAAASAVTPVPEPGTLALAAAVLAGLACYRRWRRR